MVWCAVDALTSRSGSTPSRDTCDSWISRPFCVTFISPEADNRGAAASTYDMRSNQFSIVVSSFSMRPASLVTSMSP